MKAGLVLLAVLTAGCAVRVAPGKPDPALAYSLVGDSLRLTDAVNSAQRVRITKVVVRDSSAWVSYKRGVIKSRDALRLGAGVRKLYFADKMVLR
jgi:hypothetical protein